jgi:spore germination protein KB
MHKCNGKITVRQVYLLFILSTLSPAIRLFPTSCSKDAKTAAWVAPIISVVGFIILYLTINELFKRKNINNLSDVFRAVLGNAVGRILLSIYLIWCIVLYCLYIRYYAGRLMGSIFPDSEIKFFIVVMMAIVFMAARGKIETFMRFSEFSLMLFTIVLVLLSVILLPEVKLGNIYPVTFHDAVPAGKAGIDVFAVWAYLLLPFFFGDLIINKDQIKKYGKQAAAFLVIMTVILLITVVGSLSYSVASRMALPFFNAVKLITFIETFDRFESIVLAMWVAADFVLISFFAIVIINIIKNLFSIQETKYLATPVVLLGYVGGLYISAARFEREVFSTQFAKFANVVLFFAVPIIILAIGKMRKKL